MEFNPVVVRKNKADIYSSYEPTLEVPKQYKDIVLEWDVEKHVAVVTLNRPQAYNALSVSLMEETVDTLHFDCVHYWCDQGKLLCFWSWSC